MADAPIDARHFLLACYSVHLILGNTLKSLRVRHSTLRHYLNQAISLHLARGLPDPTEPSFLSQDLVSVLLNAVKSYEKVPNRKEMITDSMILHMLQECRLSPPDSLHFAIFDWIILGRVTGARRSEWCQDGSGIEMTTPCLAHPIPEPKAFIFDDFHFFDALHRRIYNVSGQNANEVAFVKICWRFQKNNDNGQVIPYSRDRSNPEVCPVMAAVRIILRASALGLPSSSPLAIYAPTSSSSNFTHITASQVVKFLRRSAQAVFGFKSKDTALQRWTCHSIRVTAANILHRAGMSDSYIQTRLRWKSNTFLMYLRNTFHSADKHSTVLAISPSNIPSIPTCDGVIHRPLEPHEVILSSQQQAAMPA